MLVCATFCCMHALSLQLLAVLVRVLCSQALNHSGVVTPVQQEEPDVPLQKWVGKDYYNPFVKDFIELTQPHQGLSSA